MPDVLIVIPFYKRQDQLDRCLDALSKSSVPVETFVHDNTRTNLGYTKACNLGLRRAMDERFRYALLLNQDCYVDPGAIEQLVAFMDRTPRCAIVGPKQVAAEDPDQIIHGGCTVAFPAGVHLTGRVSRGECATSLPMPWVNGACQMFRVESLFATGLMDERFFLLCSDSDICFTARSRGWDVWYCADATVRHETGGTSRQASSLASLAHSGTDQLRFRDKWLGSMEWELIKETPSAPATANAILQQAVQALNAGQTAPAEYLTRRVLQTLPDQVDALLLLGHLYLTDNMPGAALTPLQRAATLAPTSAAVAQKFGDALIVTGQAAEAAEQYERALRLGQDDMALRNNLGVAYLRLGRRDDAIGQWRTVLERHPQDASARKNLADIGSPA